MDILENFLDGLPDRISFKVSVQNREIKTLEEAFDAVLEVDRKLRSRRDLARNASPGGYNNKDHHSNERRNEISYPQSPTRHDRYKDRQRRTSNSEDEREGRPRASAWTVRSRNQSNSPSYRPNSPYSDQDEKRFAVLKRSEKDDTSQLYCWRCDTQGHDERRCRRNSRNFRQQSYSRNSSVESNKSLNSENAQRKGETMSDLERPRQKTVRFTEGSSSRKPQHQE